MPPRISTLTRLRKFLHFCHSASSTNLPYIIKEIGCFLSSSSKNLWVDLDMHPSYAIHYQILTLWSPKTHSKTDFRPSISCHVSGQATPQYNRLPVHIPQISSPYSIQLVLSKSSSPCAFLTTYFWHFKKQRIKPVWQYTPLTPSLGKQRQVELWAHGPCSLCRKF